MFPRKTEELLGGNRLMTFLIPLLGLRVRRHSRTISVFFADNDGDFYSQSEDIQDLSPDTDI